MNKFNIASGQKQEITDPNLDKCIEDWCDENNAPMEFRLWLRENEKPFPKTIGDKYEKYLSSFRAGEEAHIARKNADTRTIGTIDPAMRWPDRYRPVSQRTSYRFGILDVSSDEVLTFSSNREAMLRGLSVVAAGQRHDIWGSGASWVPRDQFSEPWVEMEQAGQA